MSNIGFKENLVNEFKSDRMCLPDSDIIDAVVAFANTDGGDLYLGVENDGEITGLHSRHKDITQLAALLLTERCLRFLFVQKFWNMIRRY